MFSFALLAHRTIPDTAELIHRQFNNGRIVGEDACFEIMIKVPDILNHLLCLFFILTHSAFRTLRFAAFSAEPGDYTKEARLGDVSITSHIDYEVIVFAISLPALSFDECAVFIREINCVVPLPEEVVVVIFKTNVPSPIDAGSLWVHVFVHDDGVVMKQFITLEDGPWLILVIPVKDVGITPVALIECHCISGFFQTP